MTMAFDTATPSHWPDNRAGARPGWLWRFLTALRQALGAACF